MNGSSSDPFADRSKNSHYTEGTGALQAPAHSSADPRSIRYVKGVGPRRQLQLAQLGLRTLEDACHYAPRRYEDRANFLAIRDLQPGRVAVVRGRVLAKGLRRARGRQAIFEAAIGDASGVLYALWFHQPYLAQQVRVGDDVLLYGEVEPRARLQMIHPELERVEHDEGAADAPGARSWHVGRIVPIYPLTAGMSQRWLRQVIGTILEREGPRFTDSLPEPIRASHGWPRLAAALHDLHFPPSWEALAAARDRLAFEELLLFQLALARRRAAASQRVKPQRYERDGRLVRELLKRLPFTLTASQERVLEELLAELGEPHPMQRLLQGDVGCGKTIVMIFLIAVAVQSGYQVALMAPTELLAEQHARSLREHLGPLGVQVGLLSQGVPPAERATVSAALASGELPIAVGTHALLERDVAFRRLALAIIDEQHKFGVVQRARLARKAHTPDVLVVTATPIPRTLALSIYGDLSVSTITEMPAGRRPVETRWLREADRAAVYARIREELAQGRQGYVVYPLVTELAASDRKAATQMAKHLQDAALPGFRVGLLHGQMSAARKEDAMRAFRAGSLQLLVSTVIVEVGLDVPNASIMVIEHPEHFGLAQLHQLRGRIGRGLHAATCLVVSDASEEPVRQRLEAFVSTTDGFELAERDLELRGPGELLGRRQHGWLRFRIADLARDRKLLEAARDEAEALVSRDPELRDAALAGLRERLSRFRAGPG